MSIFVGKTFSNLYEIYLKDNTAENNYKKFCELVTIMDTNSLVVDTGLLE